MSLLIRVTQLALSLCPARSDVNCGADLKNSRPRVGEERIILLPLPIVSLPSDTVGAGSSHLFYICTRRPYVHDVSLYHLMFVNVGILYVLSGKRTADANFSKPTNRANN